MTIIINNLKQPKPKDLKKVLTFDLLLLTKQTNKPNISKSFLNQISNIRWQFLNHHVIKLLNIRQHPFIV
ncbi:hypothetical protein Hanom_Chr12g01069071 [Helianthus anomalus]